MWHALAKIGNKSHVKVSPLLFLAGINSAANLWSVIITWKILYSIHAKKYWSDVFTEPFIFIVLPLLLVILIPATVVPGLFSWFVGAGHTYFPFKWWKTPICTKWKKPASISNVFYDPTIISQNNKGSFVLALTSFDLSNQLAWLLSPSSGPGYCA